MPQFLKQYPDRREIFKNWNSVLAILCEAVIKETKNSTYFGQTIIMKFLGPTQYCKHLLQYDILTNLFYQDPETEARRQAAPEDIDDNGQNLLTALCQVLKSTDCVQADDSPLLKLAVYIAETCSVMVFNETQYEKQVQLLQSCITEYNPFEDLINIIKNKASLPRVKVLLKRYLEKAQPTISDMRITKLQNVETKRTRL